MSYRSEIAEIARYFKAVLTNDYRYSKERYNLIHERNVEKMRDYISRILLDEQIDAEVVFTPKEPVELLDISRSYEYIWIGDSKVNIYSLKSYRLSPQSQYMYNSSTYKLSPRLRFVYHFNTVLNWLIFWRKADNSKDIVLTTFNIPQIFWDFLEILHIALNYRVWKAVMKPEHFKVIERLWKIYFGDMR